VDLELAGKVALVTGGTRGIGRAEENPPGATPDLANVSLVASMSATALTEAINAQYILYTMAHTHRW